MTSNRSEELVEFESDPRSHGSLGGRSAAASDVVGDVAAHQLARAGIAERGPHDHVDFGDRLWSESGSLPAAGGAELFVEF